MKKILAIGLAFCLLLGGCGGDSGNGSGAGSTSGGNASGESMASADLKITEKDWVMNDIDMPDADAALASEQGTVKELLLDVAGDSVYRLVSLYRLADGAAQVTYCVQKLSPPYKEWENIKLDSGDWGSGEVLHPTESLLDPYIAVDGSIHLVLKGEETYYICEWSEAEGCKSRPLPADSKLDTLEEFWVTRFPWWDSDDERIFVSTWKGLARYDAALTGQIPSNATPEGYIFQIDRNPFTGEVFFAGASADSVDASESSWRLRDGGFSIWGTESKEPLYQAKLNDTTAISEMGCFMDYNSCVVWASATEGFLCNGNDIWWFSMGQEPGTEDDRRESIYNYEAHGLASNAPERPYKTSASLRKDGSLLLLDDTLSNGYMLRELVVDTQTESDRQVVQLAVTVENTTLQRAVVEFNKQSEEYKVVLRTPGVGMAWDDYRARIQSELAAGEGPALISEAVLDVGACAKQGYIMDLTEEFAEYEELLLPSVWQAGQVDGRCYGFPDFFSVNTLVANKDVVGDRTGWTLAEAMEITRESGADTFMHDFIAPTEAELFWQMGFMMESNKNLIDWNTMTCNLNGEEAKELLAFVEQYTGGDDPGKNEFERIYDGELMTTTLYLMSPYDIQSMAALLENKEVYIGYPTEDGGSGHVLSSNVYMVNQSSPAKDGAIAFLKYLLSEEIQNLPAQELADSGFMGLYGFPVRKDSMEKIYDVLRESAAEESGAEEEEEWKKYESWGSFNGIQFEKKPITEEQIEALRVVLETARPVDAYSGKLVPIFEDEFPAYFSGEKTAGEVLDVVQNRAQLYINEMQ